MRELGIRDLSLLIFLIPLATLPIGSSISFFNHVFGQSEPSSYNNTYRCNALVSNAESSITVSHDTSGSPLTEPSIGITTRAAKYIAGDTVVLDGYAKDINGCPPREPINLLVKLGSEEVYNKTILADGFETTCGSPGCFSDPELNVNKAGLYDVTATVYDHDGIKHVATSQFEAQELFKTRPAYMLYVGVGFFAGLAFVMSRKIESVILTETLRFICLSGIAFSIIAALLLTDVQIGTNSPVGLVIKKVGQQDLSGQEILERSQGPFGQVNPEWKQEWVINLGGMAPLYDGSGIQVPVNIIVFGIAGGYLRYLWDTARLRDRMQEMIKKDDHNGVRCTWLFYKSLHDLALFLLSPLLAIVVWFLLSTSGATGLFTIAAVCFTAGLITEEIIQTLIRFTTSVLRAAESGNGRMQEHTVGIKDNSNGNGKKKANENRGQEPMNQNKEILERRQNHNTAAAV